jgi:predicted nucleic acid-binding protein
MTRLWLDANVILRFLTGDPEALAQRAARLMTKAENGEVTLFIAPLVLAEVIWVLKSFYRYPMTDSATTMVAFLAADGIETDEHGMVIQAVELARDRNVDFVDAYLAVQAAKRGETICTFDETDFKRLPVVWLTPE